MIESILSGLSIAQGATNMLTTLFDTSSNKKKYAEMLSSLKQKEAEIRESASQRYYEVKRGATTAGLNSANNLAPSMAGVLNPALRGFILSRVGAEAHMKGLEAKYSRQDQADQLGIQIAQLGMQEPNQNFMGALGQVIPEVLGGLMGVEQLRQQKEIQSGYLSLFQNQFNADNQAKGYYLSNPFLGKVKIPEKYRD